MNKLQFLLTSILTSFTLLIIGQEPTVESGAPSTLELTGGFLELSTNNFQLNLVKASQTVASLKPKNEPKFDYTPYELLGNRDKDGYYHLGDINFRVKKVKDTGWTQYSSALKRKTVIPLELDDKTILAAADLSNTFPNNMPVRIIRLWKKQNENISLNFEIENTSKSTIEIGALGIPLIFNNNLSNKTLDEAHAENVFFDPYIGMDAGYLQVVRLNGAGPVLLVLPDQKTPFEAYNPLLDDPTEQDITFEGFHEWMVHTKAYVENEWKNAVPWNKPSSVILEPGEKISYGLRFILANSVHDIENTLLENGHPVAVGIPGYVLPQDVDGKLFLKHTQKVSSINVYPKGAVLITEKEESGNGWKKYSIKGQKWGRARITVTYEDGKEQTINYKIIKPESEVVADNGHFLTTKQWFDKKDDPFNRAPSVITYDYEKQEQVLEDSRAWICGLGDEGGGGAWINAIMKQLVQPDKEEITKLQDFVLNTIWGGLQYNDGEHKYGVRKSMFYYEPGQMPEGTYNDSINYKTWAAWDKEHSMLVERSYNYPHVAAAHWVMYRLARNYEGLVDGKSWDWFLDKAYHTAMAMVEMAPYYSQFGQMEGSVYVNILEDLKAEGFWELAGKLEEKMKERALHWASLSYPFGSEMPWDSTGQEEVYMWSSYFGFDDKAETTLKAILAYMPTIPHWAYNGNARRYWDFLYGGKLSRIERQIHHYGSGLNAIPVLAEYRKKPDDLYLLRVGYGGLIGTLSNITQDGFAPAAFHSFPSTLEIDGISGDYGSGFYGYAVNSATYITKHDEFGWLSFGGNLSQEEEVVKVEITTAAKSRIFIAPLNLWLTLDAGQFKTIIYNEKTGSVEVDFEPANEFTKNAYLRILSPDDEHKEIVLKNYEKNERGLFVIPLKDSIVNVKLN